MKGKLPQTQTSAVQILEPYKNILTMKIAASYLGKAKNAAHAIQALTIFLGWCLTIAIFTQDGSTDGRTRYFFALVSTLSSTHACSRHTYGIHISRRAEVLSILSAGSASRPSST